MKKSMMTMAVLLFILCVGSVNAAFAASLKLDTTQAVWSASTVQIPVVYTSGSDQVSTCNFTMDFDDARYSIASCAVGAVGTAANKLVDYNKIDSNTAKMVVYGLNATSMATGTVMTITFSIVSGAADGTSTFTLSDAIAASPTATSVTLTTTNTTLVMDKTAPVVTITSPSANANFGRTSVTISGTVDDAAVTSVMINGVSTAVTNKAFSKSVTLTAGSNTLTVTATDALSNQGSASVTVTYRVGDVDEDGLVNGTDITKAKNHVLGTLAYNITADINNDGVITALDLQGIINKTL